MDNQNSDKAKRGIESIAHLFLSQLDGDNNNRVKRTPPSRTPDNTESLPLEEPTETMASSEAEPEDSPTPSQINSHVSIEDIKKNCDLADSLAGEIVLAYHLRDSYQKVRDYAEYLSQNDEQVALISIDQYEVTMLREISSDTIEDSLVLAETECNCSELIPIINDAADDHDIIILNIDPSFSSRTEEIISHADCVTVISDCTSEGIIRAYQVLKSVASGIEDDQEIQLFICDADSEEQANRAFYKFNETSRKFINKIILPAGCTLKNNDTDRPMDDQGISEQEILELNMIDAGLAEDNIAEPETEPAKTVLNCEHYINSQDRGDIEDNYIQTEDTFVAESFETIYDEGIVYINNDIQEAEIEEETPETISEPEQVSKQYKPSCSANDDNGETSEVVFSTGIPQDINNMYDDAEFRQNVISAPVKQKYSGPARLSPVKAFISLENDLNICSFICMNYSLLTNSTGYVPVELRSFNEQFSDSRIIVSAEGRITVVISAVFTDDISKAVEEICNWLDDNTGIIATRYRHLHIQSELSPELIVIAGDNYNAIYDEALLAADELDKNCKVWQLTQFNINNETFVSLQ